MRKRTLAALAAVVLTLTGCGAAPVRVAAPIAAQPDAGPSPSAGGPPAAGPSAAASGPATAAPPPPAGRAPARTFEVDLREDTFTRDPGRILRTTTWYPEGPGPFPVVVFSHGLRGDPRDFTALLTRWAAAGFVVVAPAYPRTHRDTADFDVFDVLNQPADASFVLTQLLAGPLKARIDPARAAAAGHSGGGITTVGLFTAGRDRRLSAGIVLAGSALGVGSGFLGDPARMLFVHGEADDVVTYASGRAVFDVLPWPKAMLSLPGQQHSAPYMRESSPAFAAVAASTLDFLRYTLYGDTAARGRLAADARPGVLDDRL